MAVTDASGRYTVDSVPVGRYGVTYSHAILDSLDLFAPELDVTLSAGRNTEIPFFVPSGEAIRALSCPGVVLARSSGVLRGRVTQGVDGHAVRGARVTVGWNDATGALAARGADQLVRVSSVDADSLGNYRFCGVPSATLLTVQAATPRDSTDAIDTSIPVDAGLVILTLALDSGRSVAVRTPPAGPQPSSGARVTLRGRVENAAHAPVVRARVAVLGQNGVAVTNDRGEFTLGALKQGHFLAEVLAVGYSPVRPVVALLDTAVFLPVTLTRNVVELDSVHVIAAKPNPMERGRDKIGDAEIVQPDVVGGSALDAIELLRPEYFNASAPATMGNGAGRARTKNGSTDKRMAANFSVSINEATPQGLDVLETIPARTIREMRWVRATDASGRFGISANMMPVLIVYTIGP
jgi:hypothetical protein